MALRNRPRKGSRDRKTRGRAAPSPKPRRGNRRRKLASPRGNRRAAPRVSVPHVPLRARLALWRERVRARWSGARRVALIGARALAVMGVIAGCIAVGRLVERHVRTSPAFDVREVRIDGQGQLTREQVLEAADLRVGQNVFDTAPEDAEARLLSHPWVAEARVRRRLPGSFEVYLREHQAALLLSLSRADGSADASYLVSSEGVVFKRVGEGDPVDLPVLTGADRARFSRDSGWRAALLLEAVALLHDYRGAGLWRREPISEIHVGVADDLSLYVGAEPTHVKLGRAPFRQKLVRLRRVLDRLARRDTRPATVYLDNRRRPERVIVRLQ